MTAEVWVSKAPADSTLGPGKYLLSDLEESDKDQCLDAIRRNKKGEALGADHFPKKFFVEQAGAPIKPLKHLTSTGFWILSEKAADVLRRFDLGEGALYPTAIYQHDRTTEVPGPYYCLNFGAVKSAVVVGQSKLREPGYGNKWHDLPSVPEDGDVAVSAAALDGPDLWIDPETPRAFYMSGRLAEALQKAKLAKAFRITRCKVI